MNTRHLGGGFLPCSEDDGCITASLRASGATCGHAGRGRARGGGGAGYLRDQRLQRPIRSDRS